MILFLLNENCSLKSQPKNAKRFPCAGIRFNSTLTLPPIYAATAGFPHKSQNQNNPTPYLN